MGCFRVFLRIISDIPGFTGFILISKKYYYFRSNATLIVYLIQLIY